MIKGIIFDMDGTIIDSEPHHLKLEEKLYKNLSIVVDEEEHNSYIGTTSHYMWKTIKERHNLKESLEELVFNDREEYFLSIENNPENIKEIEGAVNLIKYIYGKGIKLGLASSSPLRVIEHVLKVLGVEDMFLAKVTGDEVERSKPYPDIFLKTAEILEVLPSECLVFEDSYNGVTAAKRGNMKCIGISCIEGGNQDISSADLIIKSFNEKKIKEYIDYF